MGQSARFKKSSWSYIKAIKYVKTVEYVKVVKCHTVIVLDNAHSQALPDLTKHS